MSPSLVEARWAPTATARNQRNERITARYIAGHKVAHIAKDEGVSDATVIRTAHAHGAPKRLNYAERAARNERMAQRYANGEAIADIARDENVSDGTVTRAAQRLGVPLRQRHTHSSGRPERDARIVVRYAAGDAVTDIAEDEVLTPDYVSRIARQSGACRPATRERLDLLLDHLQSARHLALDEGLIEVWQAIGAVRDDVAVEHRWTLMERQNRNGKRSA